MRYIYLLLIILVTAGSCSETEPELPPQGLSTILVLNEGNFSAGNGTINALDLDAVNAQQILYEAEATIQSAETYEGRIYLIANAPDRLDILDEDLNLLSSIDEGLDNPISFAAVGDLGFVSNWGDINTAFGEDPDSYLAIVDLVTHTLIDSVVLNHRPQHMLAYEGRLFIANEGGNTVSVIIPPNYSIIREVEVAPGPSNLAVDQSGAIWTLCTSGHLVQINPDLSAGHDIGGLVTSGFNEKMDLDRSANQLYFLGGSNDSFTGQTTVYMADLETLAVIPIIENGFALYAVGVDPENQRIYVGDSNAFQSTGTVFQYDTEGNLLQQFPTGIGPNGFLFR